ncbi:hypothetical protein FRB91_009581 [Serendipita sp. 411]|nr:hypothetical protein FRC15_006576 [Serendipita sp. 397]KAG8777248.1 hypothetical protein FRC16_004238 [Serendipita sp. 398]KAG8836979.1 hypothetical protein FRC18_010344 [Serendipita sp. 400]KAG8858613.1 hypothetical protein FRB91_009581 [Serendipita sp. 411]
MSPCGDTPCGQTTIYGSSTVVTSAVTAYTTTTSVPPYATWSVGTYGYCASSSGTQCLTSTTVTRTAIIDYFFGRIITTTVTKPIPVTTVATYPIATSTVPCHKRDLEGREEVKERDIEERGEVAAIEKRSFGVRSHSAVSKFSMVALSLLISSWVLA